MKKNILVLTLASLVIGVQVQATDVQTSSVSRWAVPAVVITGGVFYMLYNWFSKPVDAPASLQKELVEKVASAAAAKRLAREKKAQDKAAAEELARARAVASKAVQDGYAGAEYGKEERPRVAPKFGSVRARVALLNNKDGK